MNTTSSASTAFLQKRRFYTVLPLLICPFLFLLFWVLGGGSAAASTGTPARTVGGLNLALPAAKLKDDSRLTKMDYYRKADQDSAKRHTLAKNDPYYHLPGLSGRSDSLLPFAATPAARKGVVARAEISVLTTRLGDSDRNEALVYRKLAALNIALAQKAPVTPAAVSPATSPALPSPEVGRLEKLVETLHTPDTTVDPDLRQLSGMLDKIMAIQHPAADNSSPALLPSKKDTASVTIAGDEIAVLPVDTVAVHGGPVDSPILIDANANGFYAVDQESSTPPASNAVLAVIDETITALNGSTVPFRLLQDIRIKGVLIPAGSLAYGAVQFSGDRAAITIRSLQYQQSVFPVSLIVYGLDGLPGILHPNQSPATSPSSQRINRFKAWA